MKTKSGCFVFRLGKQGVRSLGNASAKLWNLAPLQSDVQLAFAINADFEVDIGRNQLAISSPRNRQLFTKLGGELSYFLVQLFKACQDDWLQIRAEFDLDHDVDVVSFWSSIWKVFQESITRPRGILEEFGQDSCDELVRLMFTERAGLISFYEKYPALPVLLEGAEPKLVRFSAEIYRTSELLTGLTSHMVKLPALQKGYFDKQRLVNHAVGQSLIDLGYSIPALELEALLEEVLDNNYLSPAKNERYLSRI